MLPENTFIYFFLSSKFTEIKNKNNKSVLQIGWSRVSANAVFSNVAPKAVAQNLRRAMLSHLSTATAHVLCRSVLSEPLRPISSNLCHQRARLELGCTGNSMQLDSVAAN